VVAIHPGTKQQICRLAKRFPIVQEILQTGTVYNNDLPVIQVNQGTIENTKLEEEDFIKLENGEKI
jgi:hypothetical protein